MRHILCFRMVAFAQSLIPLWGHVDICMDCLPLGAQKLQCWQHLGRQVNQDKKISTLNGGQSYHVQTVGHGPG